jgi:hypothetical protein
MRMRKFTPLLCAVMFVLGACASSDDGDGDDDGPPDPPPAAVCGDGTCASSEVGICTQDCGVNPGTPTCGNGNCENGENSTTCASDCPPAGPVCGDNQCDMAGGENSTNCPGDCGGSSSLDCNDFAVLFACLLCVQDPTQCVPPANPTDCEACTGGGGGGFSFCENMAPDGVCNAAAGEDADTCPEDCP